MKMTLKEVAMIAVLVVTGMAGESQAELYTNLSSDYPFILSLDSGTTGLQNASAYLKSNPGVNSGQFVSSYTTAPITNIVNPLPGVKGKYEIYTETTNKTFSYSQAYQNLDIFYTGNLTTPNVGQTYSLTGQINKVNGASLLSNNGYLNFSLGMNTSFSDPNFTNTASGLLSFKAGNALGQWAYDFKKSFNGSSGNISLSNGYLNNSLDMNLPIYYEASYSLLGDTGIKITSSDLSLSLYETLYGPYNEALIDSLTKTTKNTLYTSDIPALPVTTPIPAAAWLFGSGLVGLVGLRKKKA